MQQENSIFNYDDESILRLLLCFLILSKKDNKD